MAITETDLLIRLVAATILGGAIGFEREVRDHPAGLRTHLLVALASATFMLVSSQFVFFQRYQNDGIVRVDVGRIASNVVVGIGFLGGGAILHAGPNIRGLTTAATLWLAASVGLAAGGGMYVLAAMTTLISLFALEALLFLVERPRKRRMSLRVRIDLEGDFLGRAALTEFLKPIDLKVVDVDYSRDLITNRSKILLDVKLAGASQEEPLMRRLETLDGLRRVKVNKGRSE